MNIRREILRYNCCFVECQNMKKKDKKNTVKIEVMFSILTVPCVPGTVRQKCGKT